MAKLSNWFVCSRCKNTSVSAKQVLGMGNFSVNVECGNCGLRHVERDASSDNWNKKITVKQYLTGKRFRAPRASRKGQRLVRCPNCNSKDVDFWVYSDNSGLGNGETNAHVRLDCLDCGEVKKTNVSHS